VVVNVGKAGVAIDSVEEQKLLFRRHPLARWSVSMDDERGGHPTLPAYRHRRRSKDRTARLSGTIQNDFLKEVSMVRNTLHYAAGTPRGANVILDITPAIHSDEMPKVNRLRFPLSYAGSGANSGAELALYAGRRALNMCARRSLR